jgi:stress response protein SCP2
VFGCKVLKKVWFLLQTAYILMFTLYRPFFIFSVQARGQNNELLRLKDHHVQPDSRIYLLVLLYAIPDEFDHVIFDLFWGYPNSGRDYLDASVLLYNGSKFVDVVDFRNKTSTLCPGVEHSGDVMDDDKRLGHHTINVSIKSIPVHVDKLVFTLSAWRSPNISKFRNPSLKFFDAEFPDRQLCSDEMSEAANSQAIVMCCLTNKGGGWQVFSLKNLSAGNAMNYEPLKRNIVSLIIKGFI